MAVDYHRLIVICTSIVFANATADHKRNVSQSLVSEENADVQYSTYVSEASVSCTCPYPHPVTLSEGYSIVLHSEY